ncbi:MAG: hypothetical protein DHS20C19_06300 [Acidimicrobiales bacterium]|nr:MAG: hypothetical protein DHS20C19_06300 [Acidimicrobiales bacterium]
MKRTIRERMRDAMSTWADRRMVQKPGMHEGGLGQAIRDVGGYYQPMPNNRLIDTIGETHRSYNESINRRLPPSTHVSHNDALRRGLVMPMSERCVEDWDAPSVAVDPAELDVAPEDRPDF